MKAAYPLCSILGTHADRSRRAFEAREKSLLLSLKEQDRRSPPWVTSVDEVRGYIAAHPDYELSKQAAEILRSNGISPEGGFPLLAPRETPIPECHRAAYEAAVEAVKNRKPKSAFYSSYSLPEGGKGLDEASWEAQGW